MNKLILMSLTVALGATSSLAMPTKADLKKAQPLVNELMSPSLSAFKSAKGEAKTAAAETAADASRNFAKEAETEATKLLLLKGAVTYYVRAEKYDKAADAVKTLQSEIKDVPPSVIAEITGKATSRISESKAPALYSLYRSAKLKSKAAEDVKTLAAKLKKVQSDAIQRKYAEALALSGDWKAAYAEFAKVKNADLQKVAEAEASGKAKNAESGEFWWTYEPATEDAEDFFKSHAAAYYRKALNAGELKGLKKSLIEQRISDVPAEELKAGERNSIASILNGMLKVPERDYWLSETELTQGQWESVMGSNPSKHKGVNLPVENVSRADCDIFLEKLNQTREVQSSQFVFALPNHIEWAYAAVAGGPGKDCWIKPGVAGKVLDIAWVKENSEGQTHEVATKMPNAFGFYDMVGNVSEWVSNIPTDVHSKSSAYFQSANESDPNRYWCNMPRDAKADYYGLRLMARVQKVSTNVLKFNYEIKNGAVVLREQAIPKTTKGDVKIPEAIDGKPVRVISANGFLGCAGITSVSIPASVTEIGKDAFWRCGNLKTVTMLGERPDYKNDAFRDCPKLKAIHVPAKAKSWAGMKEWLGKPLVFDAK